MSSKQSRLSAFLVTFRSPYRSRMAGIVGRCRRWGKPMEWAVRYANATYCPPCGRSSVSAPRWVWALIDREDNCPTISARGGNVGAQETESYERRASMQLH